MLDSKWRKSSRSTANSQCVEARREGRAVQVRDSKDPDGPQLSFPAGVWQQFVHGLQRDYFTPAH